MDACIAMFIFTLRSHLLPMHRSGLAGDGQSYLPTYLPKETALPSSGRKRSLETPSFSSIECASAKSVLEKKTWGLFDLVDWHLVP